MNLQRAPPHVNLVRVGNEFYDPTIYIITLDQSAIIVKLLENLTVCAIRVGKEKMEFKEDMNARMAMMESSINQIRK